MSNTIVIVAVVGAAVVLALNGFLIWQVLVD